ncbi:MAG TPA: hypothetical protein PLL16_02375, partial [Methanoculleus sp.]|nr:hypothetical protein [Methanoculleus sp.]
MGWRSGLSPPRCLSPPKPVLLVDPAPAGLRRRIPGYLAGLPHPACTFGGYPYALCRHLHPTCAFGRRIPGYLAGIP